MTNTIEHSGGPYVRLTLTCIEGTDSTNFKTSDTIADVIRWTANIFNLVDPGAIYWLHRKDGPNFDNTHTLEQCGIHDGDSLIMTIQPTGV